MTLSQEAIKWLFSCIPENCDDETIQSLAELAEGCHNNADEKDLLVVLEAVSEKFLELPSSRRCELVEEALRKVKGDLAMETRPPELCDSACAKDPNIGGLEDLFPNLSTEYLRYIYNRELGSVEAAAIWLTNQEDLTQKASQWQAAADVARKKQLQADKAELQAKKALLNRFALQPVTDPQPSKKLASASLSAWGSGKPSDDKQIRFRDDTPVSQKGERYISVQTKEEWCGGSSGKVYTKGKRGKGVI